MKAKDFITETKKIEKSKPRNFVAKNMGKASSGAGAHKDKKKAAKQGDVKHKNKEMAEADQGNKIQQLESLISELEQLMPAVSKAQKNHYEFEEMQAEIGAIAEAAKSLSDRSAIVDITDAAEEAINNIRQANAAIYNIEKTLKGLIKHTNYALDDARDEEQYESRFGGTSVTEADAGSIPLSKWVSQVRSEVKSGRDLDDVLQDLEYALEKDYNADENTIADIIADVELNVSNLRD